jgi:isocitrate/isopropylmalate dehydrogenase
MPRIAVIAGDGIGPEVIGAGIAVLALASRDTRMLAPWLAWPGAALLRPTQWG